MIKILASGSAGNCIIIEGRTNIQIEAGISPNKVAKIYPKFSKIQLISHMHKDHSKYKRNNSITPENTSPYKRLNINEWQIIPFELIHDITNYGYKITNLETGVKYMYACDTSRIPYYFEVDYYILECNYIYDLLEKSKVPDIQKERTFKYHMGLNQLTGYLKYSNLKKTKEIHIIHVSEQHGDKKRMLEHLRKNVSLGLTKLK